MREQLVKDLIKEKVMCIFRGATMDKEELYQAVTATVRAGAKFIEITYDHNQGLGKESMEALRYLKECLPKEIYVGAGTILTPQEVEEAKAAGADFVVAPSLSKQVIELAHAYDMMCMPGVCTATEVVQAHAYGADVVKLFPAGVMGMEYAQALMKPLGFVKYFAVCKMSEAMFEECLQNGFIGAGISSSINNAELIKGAQYDAICEKTRGYINIAQNYTS